MREKVLSCAPSQCGQRNSADNSTALFAGHYLDREILIRWCDDMRPPVDIRDAVCILKTRQCASYTRWRASIDVTPDRDCIVCTCPLMQWCVCTRVRAPVPCLSPKTQSNKPLNARSHRTRNTTRARADGGSSTSTLRAWVWWCAPTEGERTIANCA